jgi:MATE family multidrug resistance protein
MKRIYHSYREYFNRILTLSYPIIIGQLGIVLMGVADVVMIGRVDATNLAAAGFANAIYFLITILGIGTMSAVSPLVAKAKGGGHPNACAQLFRESVKASLMLTVFISVVVFLLTINLHRFGQSEGVTKLAASYLHVINAGTVFLLLFLAAKQFSDGLGITTPAAVITLIALLINTVLNWVLIYGHWGFPAMGLDGAGYATDAARLFMAVAMLGWVLTRTSYKVFLTLRDRIGSREHLMAIFKVGLPSGFQYFFEIGAFASAAIIIGWFGENELAAHQIAINMASVTYMVATGISAGGSIAVGDAVGRRHKLDVIRSGRAALILGTCFMAVCGLIFAGFNEFLVRLYTTDSAVGGMATWLLIIAALFQLSDGIQCVSLGILRGLSDTRMPTIITVVAYWVIGIPVGYALATVFGLGLYGIWFGLSAGLAFSAIMLTVRFLREASALDFMEDERRKFRTL